MHNLVKAVICLLVSAMIVMPILVVKSGQEDTHLRGSYAVTESTNDGWLEERDGIRILHLSGSHYEMGYQHGALLGEEIDANIRIFIDFLAEKGFTYRKIIEVWDVMKDFLPPEYIAEMQGMADGSGILFETIAAYNTYPAVFNHVYCFGGAVWDSATGDGRLYHLRSLDWFDGLALNDPVTGINLRENQVLIVRDPEIGYASVVPEFAGIICCWGGFNEQGIGIGETTCLTYDSTFRGISAAFRMRMVLDHASTAEEALAIMNSNRTCGWNFIVSDGNVPQGYVIEQTANLVYVGTWFDPVESTVPFWEIEDVVRRSPMFISPMCAATQKYRPFYDPSGLRGLVFFFLGKNPYFSQWSQYRAMSTEIERQWGTLNLNSTMTLFREVYLGRTDLLFLMMQAMSSYPAFHQWVACPETGDLVISFADAVTTAVENQVHYFNLCKLLEAEPPP